MQTTYYSGAALVMMRMINRLMLVLSMSLSVIFSGCNTIPEEPRLARPQPRPELGMRLRVLPASDWPATIVGDRLQVLMVVRIKPGFPAALAGIETGDLLLELNGLPVSGMADSVAIVQGMAWGELTLVTVLRNQEIMQIPIQLEIPQRQSLLPYQEGYINAIEE